MCYGTVTIKTCAYNGTVTLACVRTRARDKYEDLAFIMPRKEYAAHKLGTKVSVVYSYSRRARVRTRVQVVLGHIKVP